MSELNRSELVNLTKLCRIRCTDEELDRILIDIKKILDYEQQLSEIDTSNVEPCNHVLDEIASVFREDDAIETISREEFLSNAPSHTGGMVRVPNVL